MKQAFCICVALVFGFCAFGAQKMTDQELDALVDKFVQCEHPDFVQGCIDELKAEGRLSEPELAEAFYRGALRFKDQKEQAWRQKRCLSWFKKTASDKQIGRLRELALSCDGEFGRHAVWFYFDRVVGRPESLLFLGSVLHSNASLHGAVWGALFPHVDKHGRRKLRPEYFRQILEFVEARAEEPQNAWPCDDILCQGVDGYGASEKRKERLVRIVSSSKTVGLPQVRSHFLQELQKMEEVGK